MCIRDSINPLRDASPQTYALLFTQRNKGWTEKVEVLMAGEGDYFIAVGAGHLVGDDSVVNMLRAKGYAIERVQ